MPAELKQRYETDESTVNNDPLVRDQVPRCFFKMCLEMCFMLELTKPLKSSDQRNTPEWY